MMVLLHPQGFTNTKKIEIHNYGCAQCIAALLELHASIGQTHQGRPGSMVFPQFTKIPVTLVFNKTNCLIKQQK